MSAQFDYIAQEWREPISELGELLGADDFSDVPYGGEDEDHVEPDLVRNPQTGAWEVE